MLKIYPSIFACDFSDTRGALSQARNAGCHGIHFDVMDNHFVPNISFGPKLIADCLPHTPGDKDAHLMIDLRETSLDPYLGLGLHHLTIHVEAAQDLTPYLQRIQAHGIRPGLSLRPKTPLTMLDPYLDQLHHVLIMSVEPGFSGQAFQTESLQRIQTLHQRRPDLLIQVDGGVSLDNAQSLIQAGAQTLILGSAFFRHPEPADFMKYLHALAG